MKAIDHLHPLLGALTDLLRLIERYPGKAVIIGGVAASLLGEPRTTADIDALFLIPMAEVPNLMRLAEEIGFSPRLTDAEGFARESRMLLLKHRSSETDIDISIGNLEFEEKVLARGSTVSIKELRLPLPSPEDLIILKAVADRPKDLQDIQAIFAAQEHLDLDYIRTTVKEFAALLGRPSIWEDVARYFPE
jgi:predicted nucleotidyltransferase